MIADTCIRQSKTYDVLGQLGYLIVSTRDFYLLPYFQNFAIIKATYSVTMNIFRKKYFLFKSFAKVE